MKHIGCVSKMPQVAASTIEAKVQFMVNLTDQAITYFFQKNGGAL